MARVYTNENFPSATVVLLREHGHDVLTVAEVSQDNRRIPDEKVLEYAISQQRILLTLNKRDFVKLHQKVPHHSGIIVCSFDKNFTALADRIYQSLADISDFNNRLVRINLPNLSEDKP